MGLNILLSVQSLHLFLGDVNTKSSLLENPYSFLFAKFLPLSSFSNVYFFSLWEKI